MPRSLVATLIVVPVVLIAVVAGAYAYDEVVAGHAVSRNVVVGDYDLSRLEPPQALSKAYEYESDLRGTALEVTVDGRTVSLDPERVDLRIDAHEAVRAASEIRREDGFWANARSWASSWFTTVSVDVPVSVDEEALAAVLDEWTEELVAEPAFEGGVAVEDGEAVPVYPRAGRRIDTAAAIPLIVDALATGTGEGPTLPMADLEPAIDAADVDEAVAVAAAILDAPVVLRAATTPAPDPEEDEEAGEEGLEAAPLLVFDRAVLADALRSEIVVNSPPTVDVFLDPDVLAPIVLPAFEDLAVPPVDATFDFDEESKELSVVPSSPGLVVDLDAIADAVEEAALDGDEGEIPMTEGEQPEFTTEDARAMGPLGEVSSFTTYHPCCASRVVNIQLIADTVDGTIVMPGEVFSVNEIVGQRTRAKGYVAAGAIIGGRIECCDSPINIGGGTSQFATTLWNAVFFGCYEDVEHTPHSIYFSRYPYIREATLGFPYPDVKWRNDSDAIVYVDTSHTPGSITVTLYGNNGGRTCESETSGNTNTRIMTHPDGSVTTETWTWYYREPLPPTTTTTEPASTTSSSVPGSSSTTVPAGSSTTVASSTTVTTQPSSTTVTTQPSSTTVTTTGGGGGG